MTAEDGDVDADDLLLDAEGELAPVPGAGERVLFRRLNLPPDVAVGDYQVIAQVDPRRFIADLRPANNERMAPLTVVAACVDDDPRSNEGPLTATPLQASPFEGGVICPHTEDWYRLASEAGAGEVRLSFEHARGDLDLRVYDAEQALLGQSRGEGDLETVPFELEAAGDLLIRVDGFDGDQNGYTLEWTLP